MKQTVDERKSARVANKRQQSANHVRTDCRIRISSTPSDYTTPLVVMVANDAADDGTPYTSSRDFRSDTVTTPTASMLAAMSQSSFRDDLYAEDTTTNEFQHYVAKLLGHEAGLFVSSGTMGNQLGVRMHLMQPPHSVVCDHRAHFRNDEAGAAAVISQAIIIPVVPSNGLYLTLEDIEENVVLDDDIHYAPTKVISLENTLGGIIMPLTEVKRISAWARSKGLKMHLDGARIWNAGKCRPVVHVFVLDADINRL